jgi:hypothetical protein
MSKTVFKSPTTAIACGVILLGAAYVCLWDAYRRRNRNAPWPLGAILPW